MRHNWKCLDIYTEVLWTTSWLLIFEYFDFSEQNTKQSIFNGNEWLNVTTGAVLVVNQLYSK